MQSLHRAVGGALQPQAVRQPCLGLICPAASHQGLVRRCLLLVKESISDCDGSASTEPWRSLHAHKRGRVFFFFFNYYFLLYFKGFLFLPERLLCRIFIELLHIRKFKCMLALEGCAHPQAFQSRASTSIFSIQFSTSLIFLSETEYLELKNEISPC